MSSIIEQEARISVSSVSDIVLAREQGRIMGKSLGFSIIDITILATAISEVARNILIYANKGEIIFKVIRQGRKVGIKITACDNGPGIIDIDLALQDGYSTNNGLGIGLPGVKRLMDEFEIFSELEKGTTVNMIKWVLSDE